MSDLIVTVKIDRGDKEWGSAFLIAPETQVLASLADRFLYEKKDICDVAGERAARIVTNTLREQVFGQQLFPTDEEIEEFIAAYFRPRPRGWFARLGGWLR